MTSASNTGLMPFHAMEILKEAQALEAQGRSICHLEVGEPGVPPSPKALQAVAEALPKGQRYTSAKGQLSLRQALARYYETQHGIDIDPESVLVTMGSSAGFILAFHAAFRLGTKIAVTRPGYPAYLNTLDGLGFSAVEIPLSAENGWRLTGKDIEEAHARQAFEGLLFASPANPTGAAVDRAGLSDIVETCRRLDVTFISDEIYHGLDYTGPSVSTLELTRDAIVINSFSKYYCMTGWRIGWMVMPEKFLRRTEMLQQNFFISAPFLSQVAAEAALGDRGYSEQQKQVYAANRTLLTAGLARLGFGGGTSDGAFYCYADVSRFTNDSMKFCRDLLEQAGVASAPGLDFDRSEGNRFIRFSFAGTRQTMEEALARMERHLAK